MDKLTDILDVAGGNRSLSISMEPVAVAMVTLAVFVGMLAALVTVKLIFR